MREKAVMYPGYDDNHNLKAIELNHMAVFGWQGRGKSTYLKNVLSDINVHNTYRNIDVKYLDAKDMGTEEFQKALLSIDDVINERLDWLKERRYPNSMSSLIRKGEECPYEEVVYCIDNYSLGINEHSSEFNKLLAILSNGRVAGVTLFMSFASTDMLPTELLHKFTYRACFEASKDTYVAAIGKDVADMFRQDKRVVVFKDRGIFTYPYFIYTVPNIREVVDFEDCIK